METLEALTKDWRIVKWLDGARWSRGASGSIIPGPVFAGLDACSQILTHWLCYITDQQRPYQDVWVLGGPIFAEVVQQYKGTAGAQDTLDLLETFTARRGAGSVDTFQSKLQVIQGQRITYTPRYGSHLLSIARTLDTLASFDSDIVRYLSNNASFIFGPPLSQDDSPTLRMVFLLYVLSYDDIHTGITSFHSQREEFANHLQGRRNNIEQLLQAEWQLRNKYSQWLRYRFHKRLWAAFRDYVKPGGYHERVFLQALKEAEANSILHLLQQERKRVLCSLELPGDTWNLTFNQKLFENRINHPSELRRYYKRLRADGRLSDEFYPEQFDISFDFAPRMCDRGEESVCPFKNSSKLKMYCFGNSGKGRLCPITRIICGYESDCLPSDCPILAGAMKNICPGCGFKIS